MEDEKNLLISIKLDENKIASRLKDINKNIMDLESQNKDLQKAIDGSGDKFGIFSKRIQENNDKIKDLQKQTLDLQNQMSSTASSTDKFNSNLTKLDSGLTNTNKLTGDGSTEFKDLSRSINQASQSTVDFTENNKRLETVVNQNKSALEKLGKSAQDLRTEVATLDKLVEALSSHPITLDTTNAINSTITLKENLLEVADGVEEMSNASVDNLLSGIEKLKSALPVCNQAVEILNQSFKNLGYDSKINLDGISTAITSIAGVVSGIASENYAQAIVSAIPLIGQGIDYITKKIREARDGTAEFKGIWSTMDFETTRRAITGVEDQLNKSLNPKASEWYRELSQFFSKDIPDFFDEVIQFVAVVWVRIRENVSHAINWVNDKIRDIFGVDILNGFDDAIIYISARVNQFFGWIGRQLTSMFNELADGVDWVISKIGTKAQKQRAEQRRERRASMAEEEKDYEDNLVARAAKERKARRERVRANKEANREEEKDYEDNLAGRWAKERQQRRQADTERQQAEIKRKQEAGKNIAEIEKLERDADLRREQRLTEIERLNREMQTATCEERKRLEGEILQLQLENARERATLEQQKLDTYLETLKKVVVVYDEASGKTIEKLVDVEATSEQAEIINQLRINLEKYNREVENLEATEEEHNKTLRTEIELSKEQHSLAEAKRKYELDEVNRRQQIIELKNQEGDTDAKVLDIQRQSLQEKINLLKQEIELQEKRMSVMTEVSEAELDSLNRLQVSLKETENELSNLNNGFATGKSDAGGFGSSLDKLSGDVGTASGALSLLGINGAGAIKKLITGIKALSKLMTSWVGIVIAAVIIAIKEVSRAFSENQALLDSLSSVYEAIEPIIERVRVVFELLARTIALVCDGIAWLIRNVIGTQEAYKEEQKQAKLLQEATENLNAAKKKYAEDEEARSQRMIELNRIIKDSELKSIDERIAAQEELNKIKEESLRDAQIIANKELAVFKATNDSRISELERIKRENGKFTESQESEYNSLIDKLNELELASIKAANAMVNSYQDAKDGILSILSELTAEEIKERLEKYKAEKEVHDAERRLIQDGYDKENQQIDNLMKKVYAKTSLEEAVIFLRQKGIEVLKEEETQWDAIYGKLLNIRKVGPLELPGALDTEGEAMQQQIDLYQEAYDRAMARSKKKTPTPTSGKSDAEKEAEKQAAAYAKYWNDAFDSAEKGLVDFHSELNKAERDFKELSMTKLQIFDLNMEDTMKELDARKDEIQAKLQEIQNTTTQTPEQEQQKQQAIAYYTEMYENMEALRTQITLKAAQERAKIEEQVAKEAQEKIVKGYEKANEEIERQFRQRELATRQENGGIDNSAELSPIQEASLELEQAKEQLRLLQETMTQLDPASEEYQEFADKIVEANLQIMDSTNTLNDAISQTVQSYTNAFSSMASSMSAYYAAEKKSVQNSKKSEGEKAGLIEEIERKERMATLAQIAFSTASSIAQVVADASKAGWPAMIPIIIGGIATVIASIAAAKSAMSGYAEGGIIPGTSYSGDKVQARVNSGEMVLTTQQQKQLFEIANGRGSQGMNYELMVSAFTNAVERMPSPTLDYQEFTTFVSGVDNSNNLVKLK